MKKVLVSLLSIALIGCSQPILSNTSQYSDLDQEYSQFKTQALTQSYLKKKMDKWLSDGKYSKNLVREIEYAKFKHKDLLKDIVALQPIMFDDITANTGVNQKRVESPFENYIQYINPYPSSVTANNGTNITTSSFTANWTSNTKASSYKLFVNGSEVYSGANTSFDVTNLSFGTTPTYYVKAVNSAGTSPNSNTISVTLNPNTVTPTSPTNVTTSSFTANWNSVSGATSYKLKVDSNTPVDVGNITSSNVTGLTAGTTHTYSVQAVNAGGTGSSSADTTVTLLPSTPVATSGTSITTSSFTANWGSVIGATSYKLFVNGSEVYSGANTSFDVTNLSFGTTPTYYVKATNAGGESPNSNTISVTLNPNTVTANSATNITQTSFTANWSPVTGATSYKLKVDSNTPVDVGNVTSSNVTSLTAGTTHTYTVQAVNAGGTGSSSNTISVTLNPAVPAIPTTLVATNITTTGFTANWNTVTNASSYKLKIDSGSWNDVGNVTSSNVTGLTPNTTHNYYVEASNISGTSTSSTARSVTTLTPISCLGWKNAGILTNGVYAINPDNSTSTANINAYCNMTISNGGWTMVLAEYEDDPTTSWDEGIQADYNPTLSTSKGFTLNTSQLPIDRTETGFGRDLNPTEVDYVNFVYITGNIPKTLLSGKKTSKTYHIYRDVNYYCPYHDPEFDFDSNSSWNNTFTFDETGKIGYTWAFAILHASLDGRGFAFNGNDVELTRESYAWTVWVR